MEVTLDHPKITPSRIISHWDADSAPPMRKVPNAADSVRKLLAKGYMVHQGLLGDFMTEDAQGVCTWCADSHALGLMAHQR